MQEKTIRTVTNTFYSKIFLMYIFLIYNKFQFDRCPITQYTTCDNTQNNTGNDLIDLPRFKPLSAQVRDLTYR